MTIIPRISAVCWARVPASVTGEVAPHCGSEAISTGSPIFAYSINPSVCSTIYSNGEITLQVVKMLGRLFKASSPPAITAAIRMQSLAFCFPLTTPLMTFEEFLTLAK